jgi:NAD(P)-dependent dehydrogenase (short-subunit alcohol dehydrogenase family)
MIDYHSQTVLVTGAASGIGAALAKALGERGARVLCADINFDDAEQVAASIGNDSCAIHCDLSDPGAAQKLIADASAISGRLDLVCSNAGIGHRGSVLKEDMEDSSALARLFEINFYAAMKIAKAYSEFLSETGQTGRLMVTASENSLSLPSAVRRSAMAFYGASKHAVLIAMEWLQIDLRKEALELHVLLPGAVYTPLISKALPDPAMAPPELELISAQECAAIALRGMDIGLFYIPTQAHLLEDMQPRMQEVENSLLALGILDYDE